MIKTARKDGFGAEQRGASGSKGYGSVTLNNQLSGKERRLNWTAYMSTRCCCSQSTGSTKEKGAVGGRKLFVIASYERWSTGSEGAGENSWEK